MRQALLFLLFFSPLVWSADQLLQPSDDIALNEPIAVPEPPDLPMPVESGEVLESEAPEITIRRRGQKTIQEYRVNGVLYMVKIVPDAGPAYYLVDSDGDGNMNVRKTDLNKTIKIPQWVLFRW